MRRNKYNAKRCKIDGVSFDSLGEGNYYESVLKPKLASGEIEDLVFHPKFPIVINGKKICTVELDFQYTLVSVQGTMYVDFKGKDNALSKIKRKMIEASYDIEVTIVD